MIDLKACEDGFFEGHGNFRGKVERGQLGRDFSRDATVVVAFSFGFLPIGKGIERLLHT